MRIDQTESRSGKCGGTTPGWANLLQCLDAQVAGRPAMLEIKPQRQRHRDQRGRHHGRGTKTRADRAILVARWWRPLRQKLAEGRAIRLRRMTNQAKVQITGRARFGQRKSLLLLTNPRNAMAYKHRSMQEHAENSQCCHPTPQYTLPPARTVRLSRRLYRAKGAQQACAVLSLRCGATTT